MQFSEEKVTGDASEQGRGASSDARTSQCVAWRSWLLPSTPWTRRLKERCVLILFVVVCFFFRMVDIGALPPYVDESANILTGVDEQTRFAIAPESIGRPLLGVLFAPVLWLQHTFFSEWNLLTIGRIYGNFSLLLTTLVVVTLARRCGGSFSGWIVAAFWGFAPLAFLHGRLALQDSFTALFCALVCAGVVFASSTRSRADWKRQLTFVALAWIALILAFLNKITAVAELPWLLGFALLVRRQQREESDFPRLVKVVSGVFIVLLAGVLISFSIHAVDRFTQLGVVTPPTQLGQLALRFIQGLQGLRFFLLEYLGGAFCLFLATSVFLLLSYAPHLALFVLFFVGYLFFLSMVFGPSFFGRYLMGAMVPLSLVLGWSGEALFRRFSQGAGRPLFLLWVCAFFGIIVDWGASLGTLLRHPTRNAFSIHEQGRWPTRDYELYTVGFGSGLGVPELLGAIDSLREGSKGARLRFFGPPNFSPTVLSTRLLTKADPQIVIQEGEPKRWDYPFLLYSAWREALSEKNQGRVFVLKTAFCKHPPPALCDEFVPDTPGVQMELLWEIGRADPYSRFQLFEVVGVDEAPLKKLIPRGDGRYPDGFIAPLFALRPHTSTEEWAGKAVLEITGRVAQGVRLNREKLEILGDGEPLAFELSELGETFRIKVLLSSPKKSVLIFWGSWQSVFDPFDHSSGYQNIYRAVSVRDLEWRVIAG